MNIRGITAVILMVGIMGGLSIMGMVLIAVVHDGDLTTGVISNLEAIAVGAVTATGTLIAHYIGTAGQTQQQQNQIQGQASMPPTAMVPVTVTSVAPAAPAAEAAPAAASGV